MTTACAQSNNSAWYTAVFLAALSTCSHAYIPSVFQQEAPAYFKHTTNPFKKQGVEIDQPDYNELFEKIQSVSPLAKSIISGTNDNLGFGAINDKASTQYKWKHVESKSKGPVHQIDKIDNFDGKRCPLVRFRSSMKGPCLGEYFGQYVLDLDERKKWDAQIDDVYELRTIDDLDSANIAMGFGRYGDCYRLGVGYGRTKKAFGISPREQMFMYGLQLYDDGSCLLWGTELDEKNDFLLPSDKRETRSKSHLFSAAMAKTGDNTFDIEYSLQLEIGGGIPLFLTTPIMIDTIKALFKVAESEYAQGYDGPIGEFAKKFPREEVLAKRQGLLLAV